jgi:hypothetical protein
MVSDLVAAIVGKRQNSLVLEGVAGARPGTSKGIAAMSMVMFVIGCVAVMIGVAMIGFGIPVNEFSFGNTLIVSGTTLATGGLIVIGLSAVVSQLHRIAESMAGRALLPTPPAEAPEAAEARGTMGRIPFPPKTAMTRPAEPPMAPPVPADFDADEPQPFTPAMTSTMPPAMRNPEAPHVTVEDEVSLSPQHPMGQPAADLGSPPPQPREASSSYFDSMWPAKPRVTVAEPHEPETPYREPETVARAPAADDSHPAPDADDSHPSPPRAAILKSGVVDGMGYTLYVDGSIEAELPQGTLRFASIVELRSHLEKNN